MIQNAEETFPNLQLHVLPIFSFVRGAISGSHESFLSQYNFIGSVPLDIDNRVAHLCHPRVHQVCHVKAQAVID